VVPENIHAFFTASGSVAGALIGLLFVALSVSTGWLPQAEATAPLHRIRASAALTAFTNALVVSLFALIPGTNIGPASVVVGALGVLFVSASLLSLIRQGQVHWGTLRDALFLVALVFTFVAQLIEGAKIIARPHDPSAVDTIGVLVVVCFLIGIARAWELIGGPSFGLAHELVALFRSRRGDAEDGAPDPDA
jgi:hypothetical protein